MNGQVGWIGLATSLILVAFAAAHTSCCWWVAR